MRRSAAPSSRNSGRPSVGSSSLAAQGGRGRKQLPSRNGSTTQKPGRVLRMHPVPGAGTVAKRARGTARGSAAHAPGGYSRSVRRRSPGPGHRTGPGIRGSPPAPASPRRSPPGRGASSAVVLQPQVLHQEGADAGLRDGVRERGVGIPPAQPGAQGDGLHRLDIGAQHRRVGHRRDIRRPPAGRPNPARPGPAPWPPCRPWNGRSPRPARR